MNILDYKIRDLSSYPIFALVWKKKKKKKTKEKQKRTSGCQDLSFSIYRVTILSGVTSNIFCAFTL